MTTSYGKAQQAFSAADLPKDGVKWYLRYAPPAFPVTQSESCWNLAVRPDPLQAVAAAIVAIPAQNLSSEVALSETKTFEKHRSLDVGNSPCIQLTALSHLGVSLREIGGGCPE
jgi:hypothetical protein